MKRRRLDELLASGGYCSRREARGWIRNKRVYLGDAPASSPSLKVDPAEVRVDGEPLDHPDGLLILMHKPAEYICSHDRSEGPSVFDLLPERWSQRNPALNTVGRLDKDTTGTLLLTDQGALLHSWIHPKRKVPKVYRASLRDSLAAELIPLFAEGTLLLEGDDKPCLPAILQILSPLEAELTLFEGRYHQVKRMFAAVGNEVTALHRSRFADYSADELEPGHYRILPPPPGSTVS